AFWGVVDYEVRQSRLDMPTFREGQVVSGFEAQLMRNVENDKDGCLRIEKDKLLSDIFKVKDPCPGTRKLVFIQYSNRRKKGKIRVEEGGDGKLMPNTPTICIFPHKMKQGTKKAQRYCEQSSFVAPAIKLTSAVFGHETDSSQSYNVLPV
ncbi:unnamed protein product, partial [marine sediment metagenome]